MTILSYFPPGDEIVSYVVTALVGLGTTLAVVAVMRPAYAAVIVALATAAAGLCGLAAQRWAKG